MRPERHLNLIPRHTQKVDSSKLDPPTRMRTTVPPNPSLKRSANGMSRRPSSAGPAAHFALVVQRHAVVARLARTLGSTIPHSCTLAFAEFQMPIQMHPCDVLKHRKTPQNNSISAPVALRLKSHLSASRPAAATHCSRLLNVSSWTHRRTSIVLLPHLG